MKECAFTRTHTRKDSLATITYQSYAVVLSVLVLARVVYLNLHYLDWPVFFIVAQVIISGLELHYMDVGAISRRLHKLHRIHLWLLHLLMIAVVAFLGCRSDVRETRVFLKWNKRYTCSLYRVCCNRYN